MIFRDRFLVLAAIAFMLGAMLAVAQTTSTSILGTVTDPSGAAVAGAAVTIDSVARGLARRVTTNDAGFYSAPALDPGEYQRRPDEIGELRGEKQRAEGNLRCRSLGGERNGEMAKEHFDRTYRKRMSMFDGLCHSALTAQSGIAGPRCRAHSPLGRFYGVQPDHRMQLAWSVMTPPCASLPQPSSSC